MQLLEREEELARIDSALADARSGRGRLVVVEGRAGIGKTELLAAARTSATDGGTRVLRSRGAELETDFAFGVVRQLFEVPLAEASEPERANLLQGAAGVAAGLLGLPGGAVSDGGASSGVDPSFAILHGLYWLTANLAAVRPLCLVVDDAHWADAASVRYLTFLLTRLEELSATVIIATRPCEAGTDPESLAALTADPSAELIRVPPLTRAGVAAVVASRLGASPDPIFVDVCLRATRGTPFLLRLLVEALSERGIAATAEAARLVEDVAAETVGRSIRVRLGRLSEPARRLAQALAVLEKSDVWHAARLAGLDDAEAAEAAEVLTTAGFIEPGRPLTFVHPIIRSGIYADLSSSERAASHRRAAALLAEEAGGSGRVAQHLLVSEPAADGWVVEQLLSAACSAGKHGAPESEAAFLRRALAEPPQNGQSTLLLDLGMAEASAGLPGWAAHLQQAVDAAPSHVAAADAAMVLGIALARAQRTADAVEVFDRAASALEPHDSDLALLLEAAAVFPAMNDPATASSVAFRRERLLRRAAASPEAPRELVAAAAFVSVLANDPADVGADLANRALVAADGATSVSEGRPWFWFSAWFSQITFALLWAERYEQVRPLLDESIAQARVRGDSSRLAMGLANRAWLALRRGDLRAAEGDARTALAATKLPAPPLYRLLNGALLIKALVDQGELDAAEQELVPLDHATAGDSLVAAVLRFGRGRLRVAQGRTGEGLEDFLAVGVVLTRALVTSASYLPWRSEAALAHLTLGDREAAEQLAEEELELARAFGAPRTFGVASRAAGVIAGGERGVTLLRAAIASFEQSDAELERARALAELGAMVRRRNRRTEARELLREALDAAHRIGARTLAEQAETELRATGARPRRVVLTGLESLTASERRIAEHAGQGLTNREIAQTLFITARTVEGHLTSIFRKLELDSRTELTAALAGARAAH